MAVNYETSVKTVRMTATRDEFANGILELMAADDTVLVAFGLTASGGTVSGDIWTLAFDASTVAAAAGAPTDATKAQVKTSGGTAGITGLTVGTSGADIVLNSVSIRSGQDVTLSIATIQHS